jgi:hypothetical protein
MAQLAKSEGRGFHSRWSHWNFLLTLSFRPHYGPGVASASNINECQEHFLGSKGGRCVKLTTIPPSRTDCPEIWEHQPPRNHQILSRPVEGLLTYLLTYLFTPWTSVLLDKLTGFQLVKKFLAFCGNRSSWSHAQVPATCPYPEPKYQSRSEAFCLNIS